MSFCSEYRQGAGEPQAYIRDGTSFRFLLITRASKTQIHGHLFSL